MHMALLAAHMSPLEHAHNGCDLATDTRWKNPQSDTWALVAGALLHQKYFIIWYHPVTARATYLPGDYNTLPDTASHIWEITDTPLLAFFNLHSPQSHSWQLC